MAALLAGAWAATAAAQDAEPAARDAENADGLVAEADGADDAGRDGGPGGEDADAAPSYPAPRFVEDPGPARCVLRAPLEGVVNPGSADYLRSATEAAAAAGCGAVLVTLDTPGGLLDATRTIVKSFLDAPVPVIVFVGPPGARAGSAGVFITLSAHVAAMAPGTNIGAAHPVMGAGGQDPEDAGGEELGKKIENDTAALARSIAQQRHRNVAWAEAAVRESVSATATEALDEHVIDLIADDERALLDALHGRVVDVHGEDVALATRGAEVRDHPMTISQRARRTLGDPNLAYLFLSVGSLLLLFELYAPGLLVPGALGLFLLLLGAVGLEVLPINVGAIVLLAVALALFVAEMYVTSFGLLAGAGLVCLLIGAALLIDRENPDYLVDASLRISWLAIAPLAATLAAAALGLGWKAARENRKQSVTGAEGLVGQTALVAEAAGDEGTGWVRVGGERWQARLGTGARPGDAVRVVGVRGLVLDVEAAGPTGSVEVDGAGGTG